MNNEIVIMKKPDYVSWDNIHQVLWKAHESTRKAGIYYPTSEMTGDELNEFLSKHNGCCLVAMDGDKVIGTMSYYIENINTRFLKGRFLMIALVGNIPEYKGKHIFSRLYDKCYNYAKTNGLDGLMYGTAEKNYIMRKIFEKKGFVYNRFYFNKQKNRFVVGGIFCFNNNKYKNFYYNLIFKIKQVLGHLRYADIFK